MVEVDNLVQTNGNDLKLNLKYSCQLLISPFRDIKWTIEGPKATNKVQEAQSARVLRGRVWENF